MQRLAVVGVCFVVLAGACSSGGDRAGGAGVPAEVAGVLAARAERVAAALDSGACDQALAEARSLESDVTALTVDPAVKAEAAAGASRLVAAISCVPPTTTPPTVVTPPRGEGGSDRGKGDKNKGGDKDDGDKDDD